MTKKLPDISSIVLKICRFHRFHSFYEKRRWSQWQWQWSDFLAESRFFATNSNQWDCFIFYGQQIRSKDFFFVFAKVDKGCHSSFVERFCFSCNNFFYDVKHRDCMLPRICSVIDHRWRQNVVRTSASDTLRAIWPCAMFCSWIDGIRVLREP